jgi:hypothetical protein
LLWAHITDKPSTFIPSAHAHAIADVTGLSTALSGKVDDSQVLTNVPAGAVFTDTVYIHPANHAPSVITQDANNRFVTDAEKAVWNTPYVHPTTHPQSVIDNLTSDLAARSLTTHTHAFSAITGSASEAQVGDRTVNDATATAYANTGSLTQLFSWFGKIIKAIVGGANWYSTPPTTITALNTAMGTKQATLVSGTSIKTVNSTSLLGSGNIVTPDTIYTHPAAHTISEVTGLQTALDGKVDDAQVLTNVPAGALFTDTVYTHPANHAPAIITQDTNNRFVTDAEKTTWNAKSTLALGTTSTTAYRGDYGNTAYTHSQAAHAPSTAQKNSDITLAEIEAKLTGSISSHSHAGLMPGLHATNHITGGGDIIPDAVAAGASGLMSGAMLTKLNGIAAGATVGPAFTETATDIKMNGTQAVGALATVARADHVHPSDTTRATVANLTGTAETLGGAAVVGVATTAARSDHKHAITNPAIDTLAAATDITTLNASTTAHGLVVKATAPAAGLINVVAIGNAETAYTNKPLFDATVPVINGTAATGTATVAARRDHVHPVDTSRAASSHTHTTANVTGLDTALAGKQATLVSGTSIKTINGVSVLGSGDIVIVGASGAKVTAGTTAPSTPTLGDVWIDTN